jgi:hypothetical protein
VKNFGINAEQLGIPLEQFGDYMLVQQFPRRFAMERGRTAWIQLAPGTQKARAGGYGYYAQPSKHGPAHMILQWTEELKGSYTEKGAFGNVFRIFGGSLEVGSALRKAAYTHKKRPVAFLTSEDNRKVIEIFQRFTQKCIQNARSGMGGGMGNLRWMQMG